MTFCLTSEDRRYGNFYAGFYFFIGHRWGVGIVCSLLFLAAPFLTKHFRSATTPTVAVPRSVAKKSPAAQHVEQSALLDGEYSQTSVTVSAWALQVTTAVDF
jgi:hypothetical protein